MKNVPPKIVLCCLLFSILVSGCDFIDGPIIGPIDLFGGGVEQESLELATAEIGMRVTLTHDEDREQIIMFADLVEHAQQVTLAVSESDRLVFTAESNGNPISALTTNPQSAAFPANPGTMPMTFRIGLERGSRRVDAPDTYVTVAGVMQTLSPADESVFSWQDSIRFSWGVFDANGNETSEVPISGVFVLSPCLAPTTTYTDRFTYFRDVDESDTMVSEVLVPVETLLEQPADGSVCDLAVQLFAEDRPGLPFLGEFPISMEVIVDPQLGNASNPEYYQHRASSRLRTLNLQFE